MEIPLSDIRKDNWMVFYSIFLGERKQVNLKMIKKKPQNPTIPSTIQKRRDEELDRFRPFPPCLTSCWSIWMAMRRQHRLGACLFLQVPEAEESQISVMTYSESEKDPPSSRDASLWQLYMVRDLSLTLFIRALIPFMRVPSTQSPTQNPIFQYHYLDHTWVGVLTYEFGRHTNTKSTALTHISELIIIIVYMYIYGEILTLLCVCVLSFQKNCELLRNKSTSDHPCFSLQHSILHIQGARYISIG